MCIRDRHTLQIHFVRVPHRKLRPERQHIKHSLPPTAFSPYPKNTLLNSMIATGFKIPEKAVMFSSGAMKSKVDLLDASRMLFLSLIHI